MQSGHRVPSIGGQARQRLALWTDSPRDGGPRYVSRMEDDDALRQGPPNCPVCLFQMQAEHVGRTIAWVCPECGLVKLTD